MILISAYVDNTNEVYLENMKKISKQINETENRASKMNENDTLEVNGTGMNSSDENCNGTEMEENGLFANILEGNGTAENSGLRWKFL